MITRWTIFKFIPFGLDSIFLGTSFDIFPRKTGFVASNFLALLKFINLLIDLELKQTKQNIK